MIQERTNSSHIFSLYNLALSTHDYASKNLLEWFVEEQVEEEAAVMDILTNARALVQTKGLYRDYDAKIVYKKH